ncbi:LuxR family transcriptional regulator [Intrasporangium oryzae NRRL B-24470]|uniref:LuxR family transcriptional regulator n=1 Tax=Intrasporangium oryzae NRRL B-24470 TaxID=1386089 RepID=W9GAS7_9MICO|nr:BTAD domain-containing putative transcriptional regulator [Intrasporangium oryzae]EWT02332.1 LuxR family transcriptional regulator [Intrasporangium oryzae NRRL B-24470]
MLEVRVLGQLQVAVNGNLISVTAPMQRALLASLALARGHVLTRGQLVDALWANPPATAVNSVQQHVSALRAGLGQEAIVTAGASYRLRVDPVSVDVSRFHALVAEARRRRKTGDAAAASRLLWEAVGLWRGAALADLPDCPFVAPARAGLDDALLAAELLRVSVEIEMGHAAAVVERAGALAAEHPFNESAAEQLMRALAGTGRTADALEVYDRIRARLVEELGMDPGERLRATHVAVLAADPTLAAPAAPRWLPDTVPRPANAMLGREPELTEVEQLLAAPGVALITLSGPGGVGKTRLAVELALRAATDREVVYVALDVVPTADRVLPTVAAALQLRATPDADLVAEIANVVQGRDLLLVLDNLEHVIRVAPDLARLLSLARGGVQLLVTSRESLRIRGEHLVRVNPLATEFSGPDDSGDGVGRAVAGATPAPAVELFWQRAEAASPEFRRENDPAAVRAICERLDGLPLAIELAAARVNVLPPEQMTERLSHRLSLLTTGTRDAPHRQQSLRACLEWSVDLLTDRERWLLGVSSVFVGGLTLASLEAVSAAILPHVDAVAVVDSLVAKSLLRPVSDRAGTRLFLLETVRELAAELLESSGERHVVKLAHARHFHDLLAQEPNACLWPPRNAQELAAWTAELPNARAALQTLEETGASQLRADLAVALFSIAQNGGFIDELETHLTALRASPDVAVASQVDLTGAAAWLAEMRGETVRAGRLLDAALDLVATMVPPNPAQEAVLHQYGAVIAYHRGDSRRRALESELAKSAALASGNEELIAIVETIQPMTAGAGFLARAERALSSARRHDNQIVESYALLELSEVALNSDQPAVLAHAEQWGRRATQIGLLMGDVVPQARGLSNAGAAVLLAGGSSSQAAADLRTSLQGARRVGDVATEIEDLLRLAAVEGVRGATDRARVLYTMWRALDEKDGPNVSSSNRRIIETFLPHLAGQPLDVDDPAARLTLAEAVEVALAERTIPDISDVGAGHPR